MRVERRTRVPFGVVLALALVVIGTVLLSELTAPQPAAGSALELLDTLEVKGRSPKTGYDRKTQFGTAWSDVDRNGCDTRNDILQRDLSNVVIAGPCKVLSGVLDDPYTGQHIRFTRGDRTSSLVQIDHVVALSDAWQKGAQQLSYTARVTFANDPLNLWAVDGPTNSAKGDADAATWLPDNREFRCEYVARQVSVKASYRLWVTRAEYNAMRRVLMRCPDEPALASKFAPRHWPDPASPSNRTSPEDHSNGQPQPSVQPEFDERPVFENCAAARAAGAAPVRRGDPGYGAHLDRDGDGVACG